MDESNLAAEEAALERPGESPSNPSRKEKQPLHLQEDPRVRLTRKSARIIEEIQKGDATYAEIIESALHICYESGLFREFHPRSVPALMEELRSAIQAHNAALVACHQLATQIQIMGEEVLICESLERDLNEFMAKHKAWLVASKGQNESGEETGSAQAAAPAKPLEAPKNPVPAPPRSSAISGLAARALSQAASPPVANSTQPPPPVGQPLRGTQEPNHGNPPEIDGL